MQIVQQPGPAVAQALAQMLQCLLLEMLLLQMRWKSLIAPS
jgi:hypothetical protein